MSLIQFLSDAFPRDSFLPLLIRTWNLKFLVWKIKFDKLEFLSSLKLILTAFVACKNSDRKRKKSSSSNLNFQSRNIQIQVQINMDLWNCSSTKNYARSHTTKSTLTSAKLAPLGGVNRPLHAFFPPCAYWLMRNELHGGMSWEKEKK